MAATTARRYVALAFIFRLVHGRLSRQHVINTAAFVLTDAAA
jgi:hypothetical protein